MTLIEVLAALSLLGSLAVAMVLSRGRLVEQHRVAEQKLEAVEIANRLLSQWWSGESIQIPMNVSGQLDQNPGWVWETERITNRSLDQYGAQIVRLRILNNLDHNRPIELTSVDLVVPAQVQAVQP